MWGVDDCDLAGRRDEGETPFEGDASVYGEGELLGDVVYADGCVAEVESIGDGFFGEERFSDSDVADGQQQEEDCQWDQNEKCVHFRIVHFFFCLPLLLFKVLKIIMMGTGKKRMVEW